MQRVFSRTFSSSLTVLSKKKQLIYPRIQNKKMQPNISKLDSALFKELFTPALKKLAGIFREGNHEIRIAGGAVRDLLMDIPPHDVDFATTATPTEMKDMFTKDSIRMLHMKGEEHGTITCRIDDVENFEITTLRIDLVCDGRRAEVQYTTDWVLDANRRDLTINSLFIDLEGNIFDFTDGLADIEKRRVAFVGNPVQRIKEDYLRILRYFRFFGRISETEMHEEETINAIIDNKQGLSGVSAERIWTELRRIVIGRNAHQVVRCMLERCELTELVGLPKNVDIDRFEKVSLRFRGKLEPMTMVACLVDNAADIAAFHAKTKLSNAERILGEFVVSQRKEAEDRISDLQWWKTLVMDVSMHKLTGNQESVRLSPIERVLQLARSVCVSDQLMEELTGWQQPVFNVNGLDLMKAGVKNGPKMKCTLDYLYNLWKSSDFALSREDLLSHALDEAIPEPVKAAKPLKRKREVSK